MSTEAFEFHPLTPERWNDLETLFGKRGACGGCWCMYFRQSSREFKEGKGETNHRLFRELVLGGEVPGILAYENGSPVGWCAVAPRDKYPRLDRSRTMKRLDDRPVWSIVCLFVTKPVRRRGLSVELVCAAKEYATSQGAELVEAYPSVTSKDKLPDPFVYMGLPKIYERAGFKTVAEPSAARRIMRCKVK
jgi:GNAT superfamily N-acetyltransferase